MFRSGPVSPKIQIRNSVFMDPDPESGGKLITDQSYPDPQHRFKGGGGGQED